VVEPFRAEDLDFVANYASGLATPAEPGEPMSDAQNAYEALARSNFGMTFHGGATPSSGSPFAYDAYGVIPRVPTKNVFEPLLTLTLNVPEDWPLADFRQRVLEIAGCLRLSWGNAGLVFAGIPEAAHELYWATVYGHARRYPGYDIWAYVPYMEEVHERLRSVSWLTFLGPELAARLATDVATKRVTLEQMPWGVVLQAGDAPQAGDLNRLDLPAPYVEADGLVRAARLRSGIRFMNPFDDKATEKWLNRFEQLLPNGR
jgi:hypothetical protein